MSQIILEALNFATYYDVMPNYYEIILKRKTAQDEESSAMLDIISANTIMDIDMAFYFALSVDAYAVDQWLETKNYSTWFAANQKSLDVKMEKLLKAFESME